MRLDQIGAGCLDIPAEFAHFAISGLECDSRRVKPGSLFVAIPGTKTDGRLHVEGAVRAGAAAVVAEGPESVSASGVPCFRVPDARLALGRLAANFLGPHDSLRLTGVTGTKGKTTTTWVLDGILRRLGCTTALFGTIRHAIGGRILPSGNTTPGCLELHEGLRELRSQGGSHAVMEVSSHAIDQKRTAGLEFQVGIFTNAAPEHLDYHGTFQAYVATKSRFFQDLGPGAFAVLSREEEASRSIATQTPARVAWYGAGFEDGVEFLRMSPEGTSFEWCGVGVRTRLWGRHNLLDLLGAMTAAECLGFDRSAIARVVEACEAPPGRLEEIPHPRGEFRVFVDYAHTDGSLLAVLRALREAGGGRVITVFGCGGDRDRTKRPRMGRVAEEWSDRIVVTSDNPRSEDPEAILSEISIGLERPKAAIFEADRRKAIAMAISLAEKGDTVIIAGKGHEDYQESQGRKVHFDDREVAREVLGS